MLVYTCPHNTEHKVLETRSKDLNYTYCANCSKILSFMTELNDEQQEQKEESK